jgi:molybdopterin molybdotransferase
LTVQRTVSDAELRAPLIPLQDALNIVQSAVQSLPRLSETTTLANAHGRLLAADVRAAVDVPGFDNSAMDGYAVASRDFEQASSSAPVSIAGCPHIATGAPIPDSADAVVPWEHVVDHHGTPSVATPVESGQHIRRRGAEIRSGDVALSCGRLLRAAQLGLLAAIGVTDVEVTRRPRVAIAATGNEIVAPGAPLGHGSIYSSNDVTLQHIVTSAGAVVDRVDMLPDDPGTIEAWMKQAARDCDFVVTTGGASVGERDWTRNALTTQGKMLFWHVDIKPGKPVAFGTIDATPVLVLPGNPGAVFACSQLFLVPALLEMQSRSFRENLRTSRLLDAVPGDRRRNVLQPVRTADNGVMALPAGSSQLLGPFLDADALAIIPAGGLESGAEVTVVTVVS